MKMKSLSPLHEAQGNHEYEQENSGGAANNVNGKDEPEKNEKENLEVKIPRAESSIQSKTQLRTATTNVASKDEKQNHQEVDESQESTGRIIDQFKPERNSEESKDPANHREDEKDAIKSEFLEDLSVNVSADSPSGTISADIPSSTVSADSPSGTISTDRTKVDTNTESFSTKEQNTGSQQESRVSEDVINSVNPEINSEQALKILNIPTKDTCNDIEQEQKQKVSVKTLEITATQNQASEKVPSDHQDLNKSDQEDLLERTQLEESKEKKEKIEKKDRDLLSAPTSQDLEGKQDDEKDHTMPNENALLSESVSSLPVSPHISECPVNERSDKIVPIMKQNDKKKKQSNRHCNILKNASKKIVSPHVKEISCIDNGTNLQDQNTTIIKQSEGKENVSNAENEAMSIASLEDLPCINDNKEIAEPVQLMRKERSESNRVYQNESNVKESMDKKAMIHDTFSHVKSIQSSDTTAENKAQESISSVKSLNNLKSNGKIKGSISSKNLFPSTNDLSIGKKIEENRSISKSPKAVEIDNGIKARNDKGESTEKGKPGNSKTKINVSKSLINVNAGKNFENALTNLHAIYDNSVMVCEKENKKKSSNLISPNSTIESPASKKSRGNSGSTNSDLVIKTEKESAVSMSNQVNGNGMEAEVKESISSQMFCRENVSFESDQGQLKDFSKENIMIPDSSETLTPDVQQERPLHSTLKVEKKSDKAFSEKSDIKPKSSSEDRCVDKFQSKEFTPTHVYSDMNHDSNGKVVTENEESEYSRSPQKESTDEVMELEKQSTSNNTVKADEVVSKNTKTSQDTCVERESVCEKPARVSVHKRSIKNKPMDSFNPLQYCKNKDDSIIAMKSTFDNRIIETKFNSFIPTLSRKMDSAKNETKPHRLKSNGLQEIKEKLYFEFIEENKGKGCERLFSLYWEKLGRYLSMSVTPGRNNCADEEFSSEKGGREEFLNQFLKSPALRKIHNKLILAIMKSSLQATVSRSKLKRHAPHKWIKNVNKKLKVNLQKCNIPNDNQAYSETSDNSSLMGNLDLQFGLNSDIWLNPSSTYSAGFSNSKSTEDTDLAEIIPDSAISATLPGALFIDPTVKQLVKGAEMKISRNAVQCIVLAVRKHTSELLKEVISHVEQKQKSDPTGASLDTSNIEDPNLLSSQVIGEVLANNPKLGGGGINSSLSRLGWERCSRQPSRAFDPMLTSFVNHLNVSITNHIVSKQPKIEYTEVVKPSAINDTQIKASSPSSSRLEKSAGDSELKEKPAASQPPEPRGRGRGVKDLTALKASNIPKPTETKKAGETDQKKKETIDKEESKPKSKDEEPKKASKGRGFGSKNLSALRKRSLTSGTDSSVDCKKNSDTRNTSSDKKDDKPQNDAISAASPANGTSSGSANKENKEKKESRDNKDNQDLKFTKNSKENKDSKESKENKESKPPVKRRRQQRRNAMVPKHRSPPQYSMAFNQPNQFQRSPFPMYPGFNNNAQQSFNQANMNQLNSTPNALPVMQAPPNVTTMAHQNQNNSQSQELMRLRMEQQRHFNNNKQVNMPSAMNQAYAPMHNVPAMNMAHVSHLQNGNQANLLIQPQPFPTATNQPHGPTTNRS